MSTPELPIKSIADMDLVDYARLLASGFASAEEVSNGTIHMTTDLRDEIVENLTRLADDQEAYEESLMNIDPDGPALEPEEVGSLAERVKRAKERMEKT